MKKKKTLEEDIIDFIQYWDFDQMQKFMQDMFPLFELFQCGENEDLISKTVKKEDEINVRLIRMVYLISRVAEFHAGKLAGVKANFKDLYLKIEKQAEEV